jgi:hypothetical protein
MISLKLGTAISIISGWNTYFFVILVFRYPEISFNYLENSLVQDDCGFIEYIVINNVNIDVIPIE